jgi:Flp pilus assembly protein TadG
MRRLGLRSLQADEGNSMIEFSLIAVMFIIVLLGVVDIGRLALIYTTLAESARAGARYAIVHGADRSGAQGSSPDAPSGTTDNSQVQTIVKDFASGGLLNLNNLNTTVTYSPSTSNAVGTSVTVTVSYTYDPLVSYYNSLLNVTMKSSSQGVIVF